MRSTFKQLFYINRQKMKKNGKCPIMGRITIDGKSTALTTGIYCKPEDWNPKKQEISVGEVVEASAMEDEGGLKG